LKKVKACIHQHKITVKLPILFVICISRKAGFIPRRSHRIRLHFFYSSFICKSKWYMLKNETISNQ